MELIYSRKRFRVSRMFYHNKRGNKIVKRKVVVLFILAIFICIIVYAFRSVYPIFIKTCQSEARSIANKVSNEEVRQSNEEL